LIFLLFLPIWWLSLRLAAAFLRADIARAEPLPMPIA
jgi:hypothetical protein